MSGFGPMPKSSDGVPMGGVVQPGNIDPLPIRGSLLSLMDSNNNLLTGVATSTATIEAVLAGQSYLATSTNASTATNNNVSVCGISIFNAANSGKNILIYSIQATVIGATTGANTLRLTTSDPSGTTGFTGTPNVTNLKAGGATGVASLSMSPSGITTSVTAVGTVYSAFGLTANALTELLTNGAAILLPNGSANGVAVYMSINTAGNPFPVNAKYIEF